MRHVTVIAVADFTHRGVSIHRGQALDVTPMEALVLAQRRVISLDKGRRPTYRTRMLVAEEPDPVSVAVEAIVADPVVETPAPRRRGRPRKHPVP